eukprot:11802287-Prorocentrum_lima.AAC.1
MAMVEPDPSDKTQLALWMKSVRTSAEKAPLNITGKMTYTCSFCLGKHFANDRYLFLNYESTMKKQRAQ